VKDEEAELDRITQQASQADIWDNEFVGTAFKVCCACLCLSPHLEFSGSTRALQWIVCFELDLASIV
jgi:hypothetical protein